MHSPRSEPPPPTGDLAHLTRRRAGRQPGRRALAALGLVIIVCAFGALAANLLAARTADLRPAAVNAGLVGLAGGASNAGYRPADGSVSPLPSEPPTSSEPPASPASSGSPASPAAGSGSSAGASGGTGAPWTAWTPTGRGSVTTFSLPAPWTGVAIRRVQVVAYLPAGYASSTRSYPVVYEAPFSFNLFNSWIGVEALLDARIASGSLPAAIYVFVQPAHSPIHDTECADSADGRQWVDTFLSTTLVQAVDQRFRTIPTAAARAVMGFSQGGFCAAMLSLQHPDVFATAISISGYYQAGVRSSQTPVAWMPFGGRASAEAAASPLRLVGRLTPAQRQRELLILEADPAQPFYGPQYVAMLAAAHQAGVAVVALPMGLPHSWPVVAASLPRMLAALAQQQARLGVFG